MQDLKIEIHTGCDSANYIETISQLRVNMFREYPYLYVGDVGQDKSYLQGYAEDKQAMIAIAKVDGIFAGASTGIPLNSDSAIVAKIKCVFEKANINIEDYYYFGEVFVLPEFRGLGITTQLFSAQDALIKSWGFKHACGLTIVRENNHPLKPTDYKSPDSMWEHLGFRKNKLTAVFKWPTVQADSSIKDADNTVEFWAKKL